MTDISIIAFGFSSKEQEADLQILKQIQQEIYNKLGVPAKLFDETNSLYALKRYFQEK